MVRKKCGEITLDDKDLYNIVFCLMKGSIYSFFKVLGCGFAATFIFYLAKSSPMLPNWFVLTCFASYLVLAYLFFYFILLGIIQLVDIKRVKRLCVVKVVPSMTSKQMLHKCKDYKSLLTSNEVSSGVSYYCYRVALSSKRFIFKVVSDEEKDLFTD